MTLNNLSTRIVLSAVAAVLIPLSAHATLAEAASFDEKVDNAAAIVLGRCIKTESKYDSSHRTILTYSTFEVEKDMKSGPAMGQITLVTPGGQVGNVAQASIGIPTFQAGDEHVVFVKNTRLGPTVLYFDQGAYDVVRNSRGERVVQQMRSDVVKIDTQRGLAVAGDNEGPRTVEQFERDVQTSMRNGAVRHNQMNALAAEQKARSEAPVWTWLMSNRLLVALAAAGIALATWRFLKR